MCLLLTPSSLAARRLTQQAKEPGSILPGNVPVIINFGTVSGAENAELRFTLEVPPGAANLVVSLRNGAGDADLYVRHVSAPTLSAYDCHSRSGGADGQTETCVLVATPGTWHILVWGFSGRSVRHAHDHYSG